MNKSAVFNSFFLILNNSNRITSDRCKSSSNKLKKIYKQNTTNLLYIYKSLEINPVILKTLEMSFIING